MITPSNSVYYLIFLPSANFFQVDIMSNYEWVRTGLNFAQLIVITVGVYLAVQQLKIANKQHKATKEIHKENLDWKRQKATQEAIDRYNSISKDKINQALKGSPTLLTLSDFQDAFKKDSGFHEQLMEYLNYFESLANGIDYRIHDEELIKSIFREMLDVYMKFFQPFISDEQDINSDQYASLTKLVAKWRKEKAENKN